VLVVGRVVVRHTWSHARSVRRGRSPRFEGARSPAPVAARSSRGSCATSSRSVFTSSADRAGCTGSSSSTSRRNAAAPGRSRPYFERYLRRPGIDVSRRRRASSHAISNCSGLEYGAQRQHRRFGASHTDPVDDAHHVDRPLGNAMNDDRVGTKSLLDGHVDLRQRRADACAPIPFTCREAAGIRVRAGPHEGRPQELLGSLRDRGHAKDVGVEPVDRSASTEPEQLFAADVLVAGVPTAKDTAGVSTQRRQRAHDGSSGHFAPPEGVNGPVVRPDGNEQGEAARRREAEPEGGVTLRRGSDG
jgi:hypothetical protein